MKPQDRERVVELYELLHATPAENREKSNALVKEIDSLAGDVWKEHDSHKEFEATCSSCQTAKRIADISKKQE